MHHFFQVNIRIAKTHLGFRASSGKLPMNSSSFCAIRIPFPPPPATALMKIGKPSCLASSIACLISLTMPSEPGMTGHPAFLAVALLWLYHLKAQLTRRRSDKIKSTTFAYRGKIGILTEKTISRMDRVGSGDFASG